MKSIVILISSALVSVLVTLCSDAYAEEVSFGDPNLETLVRVELGVALPTPITDADMLRLTGRFVARAKSIVSLAGIEYAKNVTELDFWANNIASISPLAQMQQLTWLDLASNNDIGDLSPLSNIPHLSYVNVLGCNVVDVTPLGTTESLAGGVSLHLAHNSITDLSPLKDIPHWYILDAYGNEIEDISCLAEFTRIPTLNLSSNRISDVSVFASMGSLGDLGLSNNLISDISPLADADLDHSGLNLSGNLISDVSPLALRTIKSATFRDCLQTGFIPFSICAGIR